MDVKPVVISFVIHDGVKVTVQNIDGNVVIVLETIPDNDKPTWDSERFTDSMKFHKDNY